MDTIVKVVSSVAFRGDLGMSAFPSGTWGLTRIRTSELLVEIQSLYPHPYENNN